MQVPSESRINAHHMSSMAELPDQTATRAQLARRAERQLRSTALASAWGGEVRSEPHLVSKRRAAREDGEGVAAERKERQMATSGATHKEKGHERCWGKDKVQLLRSNCEGSILG